MAKPLEHKTIVLTRTLKQSVSMTDALTALGARVVSFPTIEIVPPPDESVIEEAVLELDGYEWIVFTSVNAVDCFFKHLYSFAILNNLKIAVVGPATAEAVEAYGIRSDLVAQNFQAEGLVEVFAALPDADAKRGKALIPRALEARDVLTEELPKLGYEVTIAPVYQTVCATPTADAFADLGYADGIVFTSPSTARNFVEIFNSHSNNSALHYLKNRKVFSIGPITSDELRTLGLDQNEITEATKSTSSDLVDVIMNSF